MADVGLFTKNADIVVRAGAGANATAITTAETDKYVLDVESYINVFTNYNWSDAYASLNADVRYILKEIGACLCAIYVINYDMSGYATVEIATAMMDVLYDKAGKGLALLKERNPIDFVVGA